MEFVKIFVFLFVFVVSRAGVPEFGSRGILAENAVCYFSGGVNVFIVGCVVNVYNRFRIGINRFGNQINLSADLYKAVNGGIVGNGFKFNRFVAGEAVFYEIEFGVFNFALFVLSGGRRGIKYLVAENPETRSFIARYEKRRNYYLGFALIIFAISEVGSGRSGNKVAFLNANQRAGGYFAVGVVVGSGAYSVYEINVIAFFNDETAV